MTFSKGVWNQLRNTTADELVRALERDGWTQEGRRGAALGFFKEGASRVVIHYHPGKTYGAKFLQGLIRDIGWTEADLRRLKIIK